MNIDLGGLFKEVEGGYCTYLHVTMRGGGGGETGGKVDNNIKENNSPQY